MSVIMGFEGARGDGKTLSMVAAGLRAFQFGNTIWSNVHTAYEFQPLTADAIVTFAEENSGLVDSTVMCDEIHVWLDSRLHGTKRNRVASYMIGQTRKRSVDFLYTTQFFHQVEKRIRDNTDIFIKCKNLNRERDMGKPLSEQNPDIVLQIFDRGRMKVFTKRIPPARARKIGQLYDSNQIIAYA